MTVKTQPPDMPTVSGDKITWSKGSNFPKSIESYEFQLQFKALQISWEVSKQTFSLTFSQLINQIKSYAFKSSVSCSQRLCKSNVA